MTARFADRRRFAPAASRNREPIAAVVLPRLPRGARVFEIGSRTGEHAVHMAALRARNTHWQAVPIRIRPAGRAFAAWTAHAGLANVAPPLDLDVRRQPWPVGTIGTADLVLCCNTIHVAPWDCTVALFEGADTLLCPGGLLALYGPFKRGGAHTSPGNRAFDASLRRQNPAWGIRNLEDVALLAAQGGLAFAEAVAMPANNYCAIFEKAGSGAGL